MTPCLASVLACLLASSAALACPAMEPTEHPVLPEGATILDGGGVPLFESPEFHAPLADMGLHLRDGTAALDVVIENPAPTLSILRPKSPSKRAVTLANGSGKTVRSYAEDTTAAPKLAPPRGAATSTLTAAQLAAQRAPYPVAATMTITLAGDPPADAIGLVVTQLAGGPKLGLAWSRIDAAQRTVTFSQGGKGCYAGPIIARQGVRIGLQWLDVHGRMSAMSKPISVQAAATP